MATAWRRCGACQRIHADGACGAANGTPVEAKSARKPTAVLAPLVGVQAAVAGSKKRRAQVGATGQAATPPMVGVQVHGPAPVTRGVTQAADVTFSVTLPQAVVAKLGADPSKRAAALLTKALSMTAAERKRAERARKKAA